MESQVFHEKIIEACKNLFFHRWKVYFKEKIDGRKDRDF
jgi:hypothetical protein